jgi:uncharacterized membrane protein
MSEIKKAKYLGGVGAMLIFIAMMVFGIVGFYWFSLSLYFADYPERLYSFIIPLVLGFVFLFFALKKLAKLSGEKRIVQNFLQAIGVFILIPFVYKIVRVLLLIKYGGPSFEKALPSTPGGWIPEIARVKAHPIFILPIIVGGILFLFGCYLLFRIFKKVAQFTKKKLFLWGSSITFLLTPLLLGVSAALVVDPLDVIDEIHFWYDLYDAVFWRSKQFYTLFFLWALGFLLLAIAFFTLPEALTQKSLTEKKEA